LIVAVGYLLDTNVVSETRKKRPDSGVTAFLAAADSATLFLSVLTIGELRKGVEARRDTDPIAADRLSAWVDTIETEFADRCSVWMRPPQDCGANCQLAAAFR
jgi:predicted nucleic acid-binding protein